MENRGHQFFERHGDQIGHRRMDHDEVGDEVSVSSHDQDSSSVSEAESVIKSSGSGEFRFPDSIGLIRIEEGNRLHDIIKNKFLQGLGHLARHIVVVALHRNPHSSLMAQARLQSFNIFSQAIQRKHVESGNANVRHAWYGSSIDEIESIIHYGFSLNGRPQNNESYGQGLYLSPDNFPTTSVLNTLPDDNGLRHILLCRVILGNMEEVKPGSEQLHPSSEFFDSGVDNFLVPKKYIIWPAHINTHISPEFILSFRAPPNLEAFQEPLRVPKSPWIPFPELISILSRYLPPATINMIKKYYKDFREKKILRNYFIQRVRQLVGDKLLTEIIKASRVKKPNVPTGSTSSSTIPN